VLVKYVIMRTKIIWLCAVLCMELTKSVAQTGFNLEGHRGCRGLLPENTIEAMYKALDIGVTTLELDVVITKDHKVLVSHEPYINALFASHPSGKPVLPAEEKALNIYKMTAKQAQQYDCGLRGNVRFPQQLKQKAIKPLLADLLKATEAYAKKHGLAKPYYNIEIKSEAKEYGISQPNVAQFSDLVYAVCAKYIAPKYLTLQSFDFQVLEYLHAQRSKGVYKKFSISALVEEKDKMNILPLLTFKPEIFSPDYTLLTQEMLQSYQAKGIKVIPWTVNKIDDMRKLRQWAVNGFITDYPNLGMEVLNEK
jgi:glycerophosphoryl diester phosphodiesterase